MKSWIWIAALLVAGCERNVSVVEMTDAGPRLDGANADAGVDAGAQPSTCAPIPNATWQTIAPATLVTPRLRGEVYFVALHDDVIVAASTREIFTTTGAAWSPFPSEGLPTALEMTALSWHGDTWWLGLRRDAADVPNVFRWSEADARWMPSGEVDGIIVSFLSNDHALTVFTSSGSLSRWDAVSASWVRAAGEASGAIALYDAVATDEYFYILVHDDSETVPHAAVRRSIDATSWEDVLVDGVSLDAHDLAAGDGFVTMNEPFLNTEFYAFDERNQAAGFVVTPSDHLVIPVWIANDGTVIGMTRIDGAYYAADSLGATWTRVADFTVPTQNWGAGLVYQIASDGNQLITTEGRLRIGETAERTVITSSDHARTWSNAVATLAAGAVYEIATDGQSLVARAANEANAALSYRLESDGSWADCSPPDATAGMSGVGDVYVTRPGDYAASQPYISTDHGVSWTLLDGAYPDYSSNVGDKWRRVGAYAMAPDGYLYAGTVGGITNVTGTGGKVPWEYRSGSGIWRRRETNLWQPVNAGIPIEHAPDDGGGPPFRSDITSLTANSQAVFAHLAGRGVYQLVAGRWNAIAAGLPVGATTTQLITADDEVLAWDAQSIYALSGNVWLPRYEGATSALAARLDLLVRSDSSEVSVSQDAAQSFTALPALANVTQLAVSNDAIFALTSDNRIHSIAVQCSGAP
ncbi:MAG: hypothetical protein IPK60_23935 [Sandaracinaceae bacterium]|nr:hypothetical protein [Sandaracinaceae bacterium]